MAWTRYQLFIALMMIVTGSINTLATKWADDSESVGRYGEKRKFNHPFLQACGMFFGEFLCFLVYKTMLAYYKRKDYDEEQLPESIKGNRNFNSFIFLPPALCDMAATSLMYIGLNLTTSSSFQMLRGALIIFTGIFSIIFLKKKLKLFHWIGMFLVTAGLVIVGMSDFFAEHDKSSSNSTINAIIGDGLIIFAQILSSTQMIVEEKFVSGSNVSPLQAVGWEGIFGFITLSILLFPMYFIKIKTGKIFDSPDNRIEDAIDGFYQIKNSWQVATGLSGTILSIAFFNFAGISVTKQLSATTRTVLDSVRTIIIWVIGLMLGQETFSYIKLIGFIVLIIGMCIYNNIIQIPCGHRERLIINDENENENYSSDVMS